jgi:hypothetical protein
MLQKDEVPFRIVVEPQEFKAYAENYGEENLVKLPKAGDGTPVYARNYIKYHARREKHFRHWQLDDDLIEIVRLYKGKLISCSAEIAFRATEDFVDRYENVALAGLISAAFARMKKKPFAINGQVYGCFLFLNSLPYKWRGLGEDTDMSLQALTNGWCTIMMNAFSFRTVTTMSNKGGLTDHYTNEDGKLARAKYLQKQWPGYVKITHRWGRVFQDLNHVWRNFTQTPVLKSEIDLDKLTDQYDMKLVQVKEIKSPRIQKMVQDHE